MIRVMPVTGASFFVGMLAIVGLPPLSLFQSEFLISEQNFVRLFPGNEGYRFFLIDTTPSNAPKVSELLEQSLSDYGFDVAPSALLTCPSSADYYQLLVVMKIHEYQAKAILARHGVPALANRQLGGDGHRRLRTRI